MHRPRVPLDLHYLLTFYGQAATLESQRLMAAVMTAIELNPIFSPERIRRTIARTDILTGSDLDQQHELVRLNLSTLSIEELSKLWTVFFQVTHELSVAYQASVVVLDSAVAVSKALPVAKRRVLVQTAPAPKLLRVEPAIVDFPPTSPLIITGENLGGPNTLIFVGGASVRPVLQTPTQLDFILPPNALPGVNEITVATGNGTASSSAASSSVSNALTLLVRPAFHGAITRNTVPLARRTGSGGVTILQALTLQFRLRPALGPLQSVVVWLNPAPSAEAGLQPTSSDRLLRATLTAACIPELDKAEVGKAVQAAFAAAGLHLHPGTQVSVRTPGSSWTVFDRHAKTRCWIFLHGTEVILHYGLAAHDPEGWAAIEVTGVPNGNYLVRIQVGPQSAAETPLTSDRTTGLFDGPVLDIQRNGGQ